MGQDPGGSFLWGQSFLKWAACPVESMSLDLDLPQGSLSELCNQSLLTFILSFFLLQVLLLFIFLSPYYSIWTWLHVQIGLDLLSLWPPIFEVFMDIWW
jgi:hypothetical protein